ncbi:c-type cytochrome [Ramlibacter albus]|uniref:C-type cytochrome n=1 Tax=Ramlibacter albus TaxID=2079448 RepID=A0A923M742_9BURK|nr:c-type cytochrome [Ramlibacter albus]MBC5764021.1 c-type cytochrome [Ramlibacter albus]
MTRRVCELAAALLVLAAAWAAPEAHAGDRTAAPQTPAALYHNYCSVCHGDAGDGKSRAQNSLKPPPRDFTTSQSAQELTRERMIAAVKGGVPGTAMTAWKTQLDDKQIVEVVDYVRNTFMRPSVTDASRGRQVYARVCSVCHGDRGAGSMWASANLRPAPRDFSSPQALAELTRDRMIAAVAAGKPNTAMQAYGQKLSPKDIEEVVDYIRTSIMRVDGLAGISGTHARGVPVNAPAAAPSAPAQAFKADMKLPFPNNLKGDIAAGRKFYDANCATCHGAKGDGQGPRAYFINPKPRVFTSEESRGILNRPAIYAGVSAGKRGSEMPAWDKVLTAQEMADVSEYVFRSFIQTAGSDVAKKK